MLSQEQFEQAGLYLSSRDVGTERLELLQWLDGRGFTIDQMSGAFGREGLGALASDERLVPGERLAAPQSHSRAGMSGERFDQVATAFGFKLDGNGSSDVGLTEAEIDALSSFGALASMFTDDEGLGFVRVVGTSMSRIAEAAVSMFLTDIESPHLATETSELVLAKKVLDAVSLLDGFVPLLDQILRRHMLQAVQRSREAMIDDTERLQYRYAVGFVDLVGFTPISQQMSARDLGDFIRMFEGRAHDAVTTAGARLVKLIGDEVMFVAPSVDSACDVAQTLMTSFATASSGVVVPRGGLAFGDVLVRGGDYYGEIVNLASRLVGEAKPLELLVSEPVAAASSRLPFVQSPPRALKGFANKVPVQSHLFSQNADG